MFHKSTRTQVGLHTRTHIEKRLLTADIAHKPLRVLQGNINFCHFFSVLTALQMYKKLAHS